MEETSTIHGKTMRSDYEDLQYHIDMVVGKIGLQKTVVLLRSFVEKAQFEPVKNNAPLLLTFLTNEAIACFDLKEEDFYKGLLHILYFQKPILLVSDLLD